MQNASAWSSPIDDARQPFASEGDSPHNGPFFVTFNVSSGAGGAQREAILKEQFEAAGLNATFVLIEDREQVESTIGKAVKLARDAKGTLVVAGGDGTINSALPFLLADNVPLGILPSGTFNYVAREFRIPLDSKGAVQTLATGRIIDVPVGQVNGRPFLVNASLGLYPRLLEDREQLKRRYGRNRVLALIASSLSLISRRAQTFSLEVQRALREEGPVGAPHKLEIATLFIGNNALQLERVGIVPLTASNELTAVALRTPTAPRLLELGLRAAFGSLGEAKDILTFTFEKLIAEEHRSGQSGVKVALDGEVVRMQAPLTFERTENRLRLIAPPAPTSSETRN